MDIKIKKLSRSRIEVEVNTTKLFKFVANSTTFHLKGSIEIFEFGGKFSPQVTKFDPGFSRHLNTNWVNGFKQSINERLKVILSSESKQDLMDALDEWIIM